MPFITMQNAVFGNSVLRGRDLLRGLCVPDTLHGARHSINTQYAHTYIQIDRQTGRHRQTGTTYYTFMKWHHSMESEPDAEYSLEEDVF